MAVRVLALFLSRRPSGCGSDNNSLVTPFFYTLFRYRNSGRSRGGGGAPRQEDHGEKDAQRGRSPAHPKHAPHAIHERGADIFKKRSGFERGGCGESSKDALLGYARNLRRHSRHVEVDAIHVAIDRSQYGGAEGKLDLWGRLHDRGSHTASLDRQRAQRASGGRCQRKAHAGSHHRGPGRGVSETRPDAGCRPCEHAGRYKRETQSGRDLCAGACRKPVGGNGTDYETADHGQKSEAGAHRILAQDRHGILRKGEEKARHGEDTEHRKNRSPGELRRAEQLQIDERLSLWSSCQRPLPSEVA